MWIAAYVMVAAQCAAGAANRPSTAGSILLTVMLTTWATVITINERSALGHLKADDLIHSEVAREIAGIRIRWPPAMSVRPPLLSPPPPAHPTQVGCCVERDFDPEIYYAF